MTIPSLLSPRARALLAFGFAGALPLHADVKLPAIFGDHMVLQQEIKVPVWGTADPGEKITVTAGGHRGSATADAQGKWRVALAPFAPNTPALTMRIAGHNTVEFDDVLIGDVWLASGQSNMEFQMNEDRVGTPHGVLDAANEIARANEPLLRLFLIPHTLSLVPLDDVVGHWEICTPNSVEKFSGVAYYFGRGLHRKYGRPIGLIGSYHGGTTVQPWMSLSGLQKAPPFQGDIDALETVRASGPNPTLERHIPTVLYNGMIAPLIPYAIKGVIWYQGEDNGGIPLPYRSLFPRLITDWREKWSEGDFPFLFVQLAGWGGNGGPAGNNWPLLREAQAMALRVPNTGMATAIDIGDAYDIHPRDKADVAERLLLVARRVAYGETVHDTGPVFAKMTVEGHTIRVFFTSQAGGLVIGAPPRVPLNEVPVPTTDLLGFVIAGADRKYVAAQAKIDGDTVVVSSSEVADPVAVRYDWAHSTKANLYDTENLPALPFRSDDWNDVVSPAFPPEKANPPGTSAGAPVNYYPPK